MVEVYQLFFSLSLAAEEESETIGLGLAQRINNFYNWALGIGAIFALGIIVFGGILYITSAGNPDRLREARAWITAALVGLLVLFGSFLILKTLNPKLTNLEDIVLQINPKADVPEVPPPGARGSCGYHSGDTCDSYWGTANAPRGNFGDPTCTFAELPELAKLGLYAYILDNAPNKGRVIVNGRDVCVDYWYYDLIPCESGYNPNTVFMGSPQATGAWGLFQMGCGCPVGSTDCGSVDWGNQAYYAFQEYRQDGWQYWGCARASLGHTPPPTGC